MIAFAATRRAVAVFAIVFLTCHVSVAGADGAPVAEWKATWTASPHAPLAQAAAMSNVTLRQVVHVSAGGQQVRVRFSNAYGTAPLTVGAASIMGPGNAIKPLRFGGAASIVIPAGAPALSDAVQMAVQPGQELAISMYLPGETPPATLHMTGLQKTEISQPGDHTQTAQLPVAGSNEMRFFISGVEVSNPRANVIVAFGDSITDGMGSTVNANQRWPDLLAERLRARKGNPQEFGVANQGISGNQLLKDGLGVSALARFDRDVLAVPGRSHVVVLIGINDIGMAGARFGDRTFSDSDTPPSAAALIAGYKQLVARAHQHGLKIYGATLLPFAGTGNGYYTPAKDKLREEVNAWIRKGAGFDGIIDFDAATRDPARPDHLLAAYDSGDHLHPSSAGYQAMAAAIPLALFE